MLKVLIADDEEKICQLIEKLINWESLGLKVAAVASNGVDAVKKIMEYRPDIVITDIRMPGIDGMELIERTKKICPDTEIIIISGYRHFEYAQTDFAAMGENRVVRALKILVDRVTEKQSCVVRFMEVTRLCRRVLYPSDSFEGALQKILFFHAMLWQMEHGHNGLGRLDMALFPYYKKDIEEGRLTREKAEVILREMIALIGSQTHQKSATLYGDTGQYILLGGVDKEGRNVENELTHLFLGIFATLSIPDPKLILRVNNHTSKAVYDATARCLLKGNGSPLTFEGGTEVLVEVGTNNYISLPRWYVLGEDGTAVIRDWQLNGEIIRKTGITEEKVVPVKTAAGLTKTMAPRREDTIVKEELPHVSGDIADFHRNVAAVIRDGAEPEIKLFQVMRVMKLMEAIFQSAETNQVIDYRQYES